VSEYWKGYLYCQAFAVPAFVATRLVTGSPMLAGFAAVTTFWFAQRDWNDRPPTDTAKR
jgi:hypothetical protein